MNKIKRLCSFLLCAFLVMFLAPTIVFAESTEGYTETYEVGTQSELVTAVNKINSAESGSYAIKLTNDINIGLDINLTKNTTTILGEGHVLSGGSNATIYVSGTGTILNLGQSDYNQELILSGNTSSKELPTGGLISAYSNALVNMYNHVTLKDHTCSQGGGANIQEGAVFNMYGGTIQDCTISSKGGYGGAVFINGATFNMYDGIIKDCSASNGYGGAIFGGCYSGNSMINLQGGTIENCSAKEGGTICAAGQDSNSCTTNIGKVTIKNCSAVSAGNAIYAQNSIININDGSTIQDCNSASYGGAIYAVQKTTITINGGTIQNCSSKYAGGALCVDDSPITMNGGQIENCSTSSGSGGAMYVDNNSTTSIKGGTIQNCTAPKGDGGALYIEKSSVTMTDGTITQNSAKNGGAAMLKTGGKLILTNGILCNNTATAAGADIVAINDTGVAPTLTLSTTKNNTQYYQSSGKLIDGWYKDGPNNYDRYDATKKLDSIDVSQTLTASPDSYYLVAAYKEDSSQTTTVKVNYDLEDGQGANGVDYTEEAVTKDTDITLKAAPTKEGYEFKGWFDGTNTYQPKETVTVSKDTTFTAIWEKVVNNVKVKYDLGNGQSDVEETVKEGSSITLKEAPTKEGYTFKGWSDGTKTYQPKDTVTVSKDTTFTAIWEKVVNNVKVKYDLGNGQSDVEETVKEGSSITLKEAPTKEGYEFKGWSDGSKTYQPKETVTVSKDMTFTAVWEKIDNGNSSNGNNNGNGDNTGNSDDGNKENGNVDNSGNGNNEKPSTGTKEEPKTDAKGETEKVTPKVETKKSTETKETKKTKTGDESKTMLYVELGLMAVVGCAILFLQSKKSQLLNK